MTRRIVEVIWLWCAKPAADAIRLTGIAVVVIKARAYSTRRRITYWCTGIPMPSRNAVLRRVALIPATAARSARRRG